MPSPSPPITVCNFTGNDFRKSLQNYIINQNFKRLLAILTFFLNIHVWAVQQYALKMFEKIIKQQYYKFEETEQYNSSMTNSKSK